jgi:muramidase (phage lysozyme)
MISLNYASLLQSQNLRAFIRVIREGESSQDDALAYRMRYGGVGQAPKFFDSFDAHPQIYEPTPTGEKSSAAGAPQITFTTWSTVCMAKYGLGPHFTPYEQECAAVALIHHRGALELVIDGHFERAVVLCSKEWASLPESPLNDGGGKMTWQRAKQVYERYGGSGPGYVLPGSKPREPYGDEQPPAPIEDRSVPYQPREESSMDPFSIIAMFGPMIANLIPQLAKLFVNPEDKKQTRNIEAIQLVIDTFTKAGLGNPAASGTNVAQVAQAIEEVRRDPMLKAEVTKAVLTEPAIMAILEVGGGIVKAREHDLATMAAEKPFWKTSAVFWISIVMLPIIYWLVGSLIVGGTLERLAAAEVVVPDLLKVMLAMFGSAWEGETRSGGFNLVVGLILGGICGVYYGISVTQNRQQQVANAEK